MGIRCFVLCRTPIPRRCERCLSAAEAIPFYGNWTWDLWVVETGAAVCPGCLTALEEQDMFGDYTDWLSHTLRALDPDQPPPTHEAPG